MTHGETGQAAREWRTHWPLAITSALGLGLGVTYIYSMGVFIEPLSEEFGWKRVEISAGLTIVTLVTIFSAYFVGRLIDRIGPRRVAIPGTIAYCLAFASLATVTGSLWHWWACWVLIAVTEQFVKPTVWASAVASRFVASRGLALAVMMTGSSVSSSVNPLIATYVLDEAGWRAAYLALAAIWALLAIPAVLFFFFGAQDQPKTKVQAMATAPRAALTGTSLKEAVRGRQFWALALAIGLSTTVVMGLIVHFIAALTEVGISRTSAAAIASLFGISSILGRLGMGYLLDQGASRYAASIVFALPAIPCLLLLDGQSSVFEASVAACLLGISLGAEADVGAYLVARYFGLKHFGALYGAIVGVISFAIGVGPVLAGTAFDLTGSYRSFFAMGIPACLTAACCLIVMGRYPQMTPPGNPEANDSGSVGERGSGE